MTKSDLSGKKKRRKQIRLFFGTYYIVITFLLLWNLAHCSRMDWVYRDLFLTGQEEGQDVDSVTILDQGVVTMETGTAEGVKIGKNARMCGIMLLRYENEGNLRFYDEKLRAEVFSSESGAELGGTVLDLITQTPYSQDETRIYIPFTEALEGTAEEPLKVRISSEGFYRNGIRLFTARTGDSGALLIGRAVYEKKTYSFFSAVVFFLFEAAFGYFCLILCTKRGVPVFRDSRDRRLEAASLQDFPAYGQNNTGMKEWKKAAAPALVLILLLALAGYTYRTAVVPAAQACTAQYILSGAIERDSLSMSPGDKVRQTIIPRQDSLGGIGIRIRGREDGEKVDLKDSLLSWRILDEEENILAGGNGLIKDLREASSVLTEITTEKEVLKASSDYLLLALDSTVEQADGRHLIFELVLEKTGSDDTKAVPLQTSTGGNGIVSVNGEQENEELCLLGVYRNNGFLKGYFLRVTLAVLLVFVLFSLIACLSHLRGAKSMEYGSLKAARVNVKLVFLFILMMGLIFSFVTPAYTVPDERTHIETIYAMSNRFLGIMNPGGPERLMKRVCDVDAQIMNTMPLSMESYRRQTRVFESADKAKTLGQGAGRISVYGRNSLGNAVTLSYLPAAAGFTIARLFGRNMITMIMAARWCNLIVCALLMALAAGRMPFGGISLGVIGLFPRTLQLMASCSYDGMIMTGIFVFIAWCYRFIEDDSVCAADIMVFVFSGIYTALCKGGAYLPVTGIVLLIPLMKKEIGGKVKIRLFKAAFVMLAAAGLLFFVKNAATIKGIFSRSSGEVIFWTGEQTLYTFSDIIADPARFLKIILNTLYVRGDSLIGEMVGNALFQKWFIVYGFIILMLLGLLAGKGEIKRFQLRYRLLILLFAAASAALIWLSMLLSFTSSDALYIGGLQGRYFLPLLPLIFPALENRLIQGERLEESLILYAAGVLSAVAVFHVFLNCFSPL